MTTTNLQPPRRHWYDLPTPVAAALVIFFLLLIGLVVGKIRSMPSPAAEVKPVIIVASPLPQGIPPTTVPVAQVAALPPNALRRAVVAYDSPNGSVIGAIEQGRPYSVLARYGSDWLQADVSGSGVVWLKADQVLDLPDGLVDLEPPPAPAVVYVNQPVYIASQPEQAAPTPNTDAHQYFDAPPPTMDIRSQAILDRSGWAAAAATAQAGR